MELFAHIQELENELSYFSSSVMVKEKESMRKELEKTKLKLKETENKLRNVVQEKTKLEVFTLFDLADDNNFIQV